MRIRRRHLAAAAMLVIATATACVRQGGTGSSGEGAAASPGAVGSVSAQGISKDRCAANRSAGKITYLSGFDFAAAASIVEVVVAKEKGYFEQMCLDVDLKSGFSASNYAMVAANTAQFSSAGSYAELLQNNKNDAQLTAVAIDGNVGIDTLLVKPESGITKPADLKGKKIGVKGALPPAEVAMLSKYGLKQGKDYTTVMLSGYNPLAHWQQPIDALPAYKSNEPHTLEQAKTSFTALDPAKEGIPGHFGVLYTSAQFRNTYPSAAQDFVRAAMKAMADAQANPKEAVDACVKLITDGGNKNYLSLDTETFRWNTEAALVKDHTPAGAGIGTIRGDELNNEVETYTQAGFFTAKPKTDGTYDENLIKGVYQGAEVIWPQAGASVVDSSGSVSDLPATTPATSATKPGDPGATGSKMPLSGAPVTNTPAKKRTIMTPPPPAPNAR